MSSPDRSRVTLLTALSAGLAFPAQGINDVNGAGLGSLRWGGGMRKVPEWTGSSSPGGGSAAMASLLEAVARNGDRQAFALLFRHYAPRIKTYLRKLGAEDSLAEDLAQEAMLAVWSRAALFDPTRANAGTWIFAIARNLRIDRLRKEKRPEMDCSDPEMVPDPAPPADQTVATRQGERKVRAALALLPDAQAEVVTLSFYQDTPHAEIASRLGIPLGTVKSRLRLAMRHLRASLGDYWP